MGPEMAGFEDEAALRARIELLEQLLGVANRDCAVLRDQVALGAGGQARRVASELEAGAAMLADASHVLMRDLPDHWRVRGLVNDALSILEHLRLELGADPKQQQLISRWRRAVRASARHVLGVV